MAPSFEERSNKGIQKLLVDDDITQEHKWLLCSEIVHGIQGRGSWNLHGYFHKVKWVGRYNLFADPPMLNASTDYHQNNLKRKKERIALDWKLQKSLWH